jgi:hypothetical protein
VSPAGPRRPGGQAANLNAVRNPWATYWSRRALKPEHRWALALVRDYVPSLIAEKGGPENVAFAEQRVMELAATARVCWALALAAGDLETVARFMAQERAALESIGLERRAKPVPTLAEIIAEHDARERETAGRAAHQVPAGRAAGDATTAAPYAPAIAAPPAAEPEAGHDGDVRRDGRPDEDAT